MPSQAPLPPAVVSALGLGLDAFVAVGAAVAAGIADARAAFELRLASPSPAWGFLVLAGVEPLIDALERFRPRADELDWLLSVGAVDAPTRRRLLEARFTCDVASAPEGTVVFPGEAVLSVEGPFWQAQMAGGLAQAAVSDATVVATRFARMRLASGGFSLVEDGASTAHRLGGTPLLARAAYVGGAIATTSALAARRYQIPVLALQPARFDLASGDFSHTARAWLAACPGECVVRIEPARAVTDLPKLALAVRARATASPDWDPGRVIVELPGGDRVGLGRLALRAFIDQDLPPPRLLVSGDVDERLALELRAELALGRVDHTAQTPEGRLGRVDHTAQTPEGRLDKLFAVRAEGMAGAGHIARYDLVALESGGTWSPRLRVGEDVDASSDPGRKLLVRYVDPEGHPVADVAHGRSERFVRAKGGRYVDRASGMTRRLEASSGTPLRESVLREGKRSGPAEPPSALRQRAIRAVDGLDEGHRRSDRVAQAEGEEAQANGAQGDGGAVQPHRERLRRLRPRLGRVNRH